MPKIKIIIIKFTVLTLLLLSCSIIYCQNSREVDSLFKVIKNTKSDTIKVEAYSNLFFIYEFSDTVKAQFFIKQELNLSRNLKNKAWLASAYTHFAFFYEDKSDLNKAIEFHQKALKLYKENTLIKVKEKIKNESACYNNIALIYGKLGIYDKAIDYYFLSLKMDEILKDSSGIATSYSNIGIIQRKLRNNDKALEYYFKALKIVEKLNDENSMALCYNNIGLAYQYKKDYSKATYYLLKSLKINEKANNLNRISGCYNNLGNVYFELGEYNKCVNYYNKSLDIRYQIGDKEGQSSVLGNIAALNVKLKQYNLAVENANKSFSIAKEINVLPWQLTAYEVLSKTYDSIKNYKKAYEYQKLFKILNDSMFSIESNQQIKGMEAKYQNDKKQKEIELLNKDKQLQETEIKQQIIVKYAFVIGFTLMILLVSFVYRNYRNKKKANVLLKQQNIEISQQKEEISTQRDEIEAQRDLVTHQKEHIEEIHKEVTDSINYAKRIQEAVLPVSESARSVLGEHFILFKPKDVVSGDFYWTTKVNNWLIVTVADCTGHGVPGAFMSMLGISFLNEIVRKQEVTQANQVLNELRKEVINALQQRGKTGEQKDGMDISLLVVNTETNECQWAGANNPLYIVRGGQNPQGLTKPELLQNLEGLEEIKGDKMPIAIHLVMSDFTNHEFKAEKGDCLYLFSDGFADQFGGPKGKKFMYKQFKEILVQTCPGMSQQIKTMNEQKELLEKAINEWIGNGEQVDDITILGLKL